jgi:hypothetical protein
MLSQYNFADENIYEIIDIVNASIYWKNVNGYYLGCNKYMLSMFRLNSRSDIISKNDYDLLPKKNSRYDTRN